ncbi:MAG: sulfatase-modifying factor protein [Flavobacteriaceae bacterium]|nr:sulfatase-modifying factor protein [Flavobacteriaceae bacterium]
MKKFYLFIILFCFFTYSQDNIFQDYNQLISENDYNLKMVAIDGGIFKMGNDEGEDDEMPSRNVKISSFWIGKYEITWDIFNLFLSRKIDSFQVKKNYENEINLDVDAVSGATAPYVDMSFGMGVEGYPAISMTQLTASKFCEWLSAMTGNYYRLPTEAEWEYAARSGSESLYHYGNSIDSLSKYAWYKNNSNGKYQKVGQKLPNDFGLHDMHGNVSEWTLDQYDEDGYKNVSDSLIINPFNEPVREYPRVVRGGSWMDNAEDLKSSKRIPSEKRWKRRDPQFPKSRWWHTNAQFLGFRIVRPFNKPNNVEIESYWIK